MIPNYEVLLKKIKEETESWNGLGKSELAVNEFCKKVLELLKTYQINAIKELKKMYKMRDTKLHPELVAASLIATFLVALGSQQEVPNCFKNKFSEKSTACGICPWNDDCSEGTRARKVHVYPSDLTFKTALEKQK